MAVANSSVIDGRIAILQHCMANLTVYLLESSDSKSVDSHFEVPWKTAKQVPLGHHPPAFLRTLARGNRAAAQVQDGRVPACSRRTHRVLHSPVASGTWSVAVGAGARLPVERGCVYRTLRSFRCWNGRGGATGGGGCKLRGLRGLLVIHIQFGIFYTCRSTRSGHTQIKYNRSENIRHVEDPAAPIASHYYKI
jgi:hypothetical protein